MTQIIKHEYDLENIEAPHQEGFHLYTPDRDEERPYRDALAYLVFKWQFFAQLIYSGMEIKYVSNLPTAAATDSHTIFLNPPMFELLEIKTVPEKVFVFAHEVSHRVLNHLPMSVVWRKTKQVLLSNGSVLPYDDDMMNKAMDFGINAMLKHSGVGRMPACALFDESLSAEGMEGCVEIYEKMHRRGGGGSRTGSLARSGGGKPVYVIRNGGGEGFDIHVAPSDAQIARDKGKREQEIVAAAQLTERTQGSIPGALRRIIDDIVDPKVPWQKYLRTSMQRKAGVPKLDWRHRNRRLAGREPDPLYYAKTGHIGAGTIVCIGDNSGSIGDKETNVFSSEMAGIVADLNPMRFVVIWCDAAVTKVDELETPSDLVELFAKWKEEGVGGGGGTDFRPAFAKIAEMELDPDMVVFFTDGYGDFPAVEPRYPVIWASISGGKVNYPFGEVIDIDI